MRTYTTSRALYDRARNVLAGGVSSEFRKFSYPHPLFFTHGQGSHIYDVDGNDYLDFTLSQGPLILGHSHPAVLDRVTNASAAGQLYGAQQEAEIELAEHIQRLVPCAELMRFGLDGSTAVHTALRLARATTGRPKFLRFEGHYHGWLDNVAFGINGAAETIGQPEDPVPTPWTAGLPTRVFDEALVLPWNNLALVQKLFETRGAEIAAVITEPVMCNNGCIPPAPGFLAGLRQLCNQYNSVLIFDEVITGFRLGLSGAQGFFDVIPDIGIFGKALANGYPLGVIAGRRELMQPIAEGQVIHAGTMNASVPTIAAALATLETLEQEQIHTRLFTLGRRLMDGLRAAARKSEQPLLVQGPGPMFHVGFTQHQEVRDYRESLSFDKARGAAFVGAMQDRGVRLIGRGLWYLSAAHREADIDYAVEIAYEALQALPEMR